MEVKGRPSPRRRSGGVKLEEVRAGGRRRGREQPRQSRVGSVLPDGPGAVSETGRYTRGTGCVTPLHSAPALTRWMRAGLRCAPARVMTGRGTPGRGLISSGQEVTVKVYGVADDDAAGAEPGA